MRIVDVCPFYSPRGGGVRTYIEQKLRTGPELGHEIVVLVPGDEDAVIERGPGARIIALRNPRFPLDRRYGYFSSAAQVHARLDELAPDFVEASSPWRSASMVAEWQGNAPRSLIMHADPLAAFAYRWFGGVFAQDTIDWQFSVYWEHLRRHAHSYDHVVCANLDLTRRLAAGGVVHTVTVPMGVELGRFSAQHRDPALRAELLAACDLPENASLLLGIGRLAPEKRWPMVLDAISAVGQDMPLGMVLFGEGRERRAILKHMAGNPHVRLFEPNRDPALFARIIASADALVHGSDAETFCMAAAEARASGIPVIVPDRGAAADHAADGAGVTYRANDSGALSQAIRTVLASGTRPKVDARSMAQHFEDLFRLYEASARKQARAA